MFSKACEYGIRATIFIMMQTLDGFRVSLHDIATAIESPEAYTAKILQTLVRHDVIHSVKGPYGGFEIKKEKTDTLRLCEIVTALDGDKLLTQCCLGLAECNDDYPCPAHGRYVRVKKELKQMLTQTSVYEMAVGHGIGLTNLAAQNKTKSPVEKTK